jgi:hypothetical protein
MAALHAAETFIKKQPVVCSLSTFIFRFSAFFFLMLLPLSASFCL